MMEMKDWISFFIGLILTAAGVLPLLSSFGIGPEAFALSFLPAEIFFYIVAVAGFYLMVNSVIEITNSNAIGWLSFLVAVLLLGVGVLQVLHKFSIGPDFFALSFISSTVYYIIFTIEGIFLMIATFAMEL